MILVTGGGRSGKSAYALELGESVAGPRIFIATGLPFDEETAERIRRHRQDREGRGWDTVEEPLLLEKAILDCRGARSVLIDCLTLWVNNLLMEEDRGGVRFDEDLVTGLAGRLVLSARSCPDCVHIFVTNEVGLGIIPENPLARRYRDLVGRCNQVLAAAADEVVFVCCGIPMYIKKEKVS